MIKFIIAKGKLVLDPSIILLKDLNDLYNCKQGDKLLQVIYYTHAKDVENPFKDLDRRVISTNVLQAVFGKAEWKDLKTTKETDKIFDKAEKCFLYHCSTPETRLKESLEVKMDEITTMLNENTPVIEENVNPTTGEIKFSSNMPIILNAFSKIEVLMKSKQLLESSIVKSEGANVRRGSTSFREMNLLGTTQGAKR